MRKSVYLHMTVADYLSTTTSTHPLPTTSLSMMALLSLNYDVLSAIVDQTDPGSALKLSMASRGAYALGIAQALASVTLSRSQLQVSTFCNFILAEPSRISHLRELTIESPAFGVARHIEFQRTADFSAAAELADVLERAYRLQHLSIACFEGLIASEPRIGDAICALPDLVGISLHNCGQLAMDVLSRLRSPLLPSTTIPRSHRDARTCPSGPVRWEPAARRGPRTSPHAFLAFFVLARKHGADVAVRTRDAELTALASLRRFQ